MIYTTVLKGPTSFSVAPGGAAGCSATGAALKISGAITDAATGGTLGATTTVDIIVPSITGWTKPYESPTQSSGTWTSANTYPPCTNFFLHVASTAGNKFYDNLFGPYTTGMGAIQPAATSNCVNCVWGVPNLSLWQESTAANEKWQLVDSLGVSCGTANGGSADAHTAVQAGSAGANTLLLSLTLTLAGTSASTVTAYGVPMPWITPTLAPPGAPGPGTTTLGLTAWYATNRTVGNAWIQQNGWTPTSQQPAPTIGTLFYRTLPAVYSSKTGGGTLTLQIPLDLTNGPGAGKRVQTAIWITDNQLPTDSATAVPDGAPSAQGAFSTTGPSANAFSFTSFTTASGRWTGYLINCGVTQ